MIFSWREVRFVGRLRSSKFVPGGENVLRARECKGSEIEWQRKDFLAAGSTVLCSGKLMFSGIHRKKIVTGEDVGM